MHIDKIIMAIWDGREWIFSGIGITALGLIGKFIIGKKSNKNLDMGNVKLEDILDKKNQCMQNGNNTMVIEGNGNVTGNGNYITNNYIYPNNDKADTNKDSWFSKRFEKLLSLLNDAKGFNEKEYTIEYVSSLIGLKNVEDLKVYLTKDKEPDDDFKKKFVDVFGVNEEWIVHGRGEFPFASNINFWGNNPMDILRKEDLKQVEKFIIVIGKIEGKRQACIIQQRDEFYYELYPKYFTLFPGVGATGTTNLVEFYRFLREANKIKKLGNTVYVATEEQMEKLIEGEFPPKKVESFSVARNFVNDFMSINEEEIEQNKKYYDNDFILVQKIIAKNINDIDRINQEYDSKIITEKLGENQYGEQESVDDIDLFDNSTTFFSYRFGKAFPGVRGTRQFTNPKECIDKLQILLRKPLDGKNLRGPIWWFRGSSNYHIDNFEKISDEKFLLNGDEIKVKQIIVYAAEYYKKFVYIEAYPEKETGLYQNDKKFIEQWTDNYGYYNEEYAEYEGEKITRAEYDDGAAEINGKTIDLKGKAKLRIRYITPYNFIICAQFNPINNSKYDEKMEKLLNGILKGKNSIEEIIELVKQMPKSRREI